MEVGRRGFIIGLGAVFAAPAIVRASSLMPIKVYREPVSDWLPCHGQQLSRTRYAELFRALGVTYGGGDGFSTFNLPDLRPRIHSLTPNDFQPALLVEHRIATRDLAHDGGVPMIVPGQIFPTLTKNPFCRA
jgi:hypothetical protein